MSACLIEYLIALSSRIVRICVISSRFACNLISEAIFVCSSICFSFADSANESATSFVSLLISRSVITTGAVPSSIRANVSRFFISPDRRSVCLRIFLLHLLSPLCSSIASVFARIIASGVLISWPASVTNCFCFSRFSAIGRIARLESAITKSNIKPQPTTKIRLDISSTASIDCRSLLTFRNTIFVPRPSFDACTL